MTDCSERHRPELVHGIAGAGQKGMPEEGSA
jgi:hypothetical protein